MVRNRMSLTVLCFLAAALASGECANAQTVVENKKLNFANDIVPLLTRAGCNSGGCHGKQAGRKGFKLSLFGFDPAFDHQALTIESRGRRVFPAAPEKSLVLAKATNRVAHGGGQRFDEDSRAYRLLLQWIRQGMPFGEAGDARLIGIAMLPTSRTLGRHDSQQLSVTATYSDGSTRDVTNLATYTTNAEALTEVDAGGVAKTTDLGGESTVMANYMGHVAGCRITVPMNEVGDEIAKLLAEWQSDHFIDKMVATKWQRLGLAPSAECDDSTFVRRVFLDCVGRLPTLAETRMFLADATTDKRQRLVDDLLGRNEYADYWALKWADLFKVNSETLGAKNAQLFDAWLRDAFRDNMRYDEFVRRLITAQGSTYREQPTNFYKAFDKPNDLTIAVSQIFLGVRLECAQCHHHPYEKWGQDEFYGLAAFFPRLTRKKGDEGEELLFASARGDVKHPLTAEIVLPRVLGGEPLEIDVADDRRRHLADWMTRPDNPFVARTLVNRVWAHFMGVGLVDPIDDMRDTNPPTNGELLDALAGDFVERDFDMKHLIRTITSAKVYGLSSLPNRWNIRDNDNFSRAYRKRLAAEVLLDAVCDATGVPESFDGMPPGTRAVEVWNNRLPSGFLDIFGRPERKTVCDCERTMDTSLAQVLHLMNAPLVNAKIQSPLGRVDRLVRSKLSPSEIVDELYLVTLSRLPSVTEREDALTTYTAADEYTRRLATEDVLWALINTAEFVLNH
ncbi:MAG: hypothetical protein ACI9G1_005351 [Pirellulaceae bacterium]|jgi:hypothetical protein